MEASDDAPVRGAEATMSGETAGGNVAIERLELEDILSFGLESPPIELRQLGCAALPGLVG